MLSTLSLMACTGHTLDTHYVPIGVGPHQGQLTVRSWKEIRDEQVVMQGNDYSCGAASLATLLTYYYNQTVSEADVMQAADKTVWFSLADLHRVLPQFKMKGVGLALSFEQLKNLKVPVIIYIEHKGGPHFAVLRQVTDEEVWVADPANGNNRYPIKHFRRKWEVRDDAVLKGRILLVLPQDKQQPVTNDFFYPYHATR